MGRETAIRFGLAALVTVAVVVGFWWLARRKRRW
jgi:hypothetical protein